MPIVEKSRKIEKLKVNFISLVKYPANEKGIVLKSDGTFEYHLTHFQKDIKKGILYGCNYEPDTVDAQDDYADAPTIETAAHDFLAAGRVQMVDQEHDYGASKGTVVESFIKNGPDNRFPNVKDGAWCVAIKLSPEALAHIDEINGLSMAGVALRKGDTDSSVTSDPRVKLTLRKGGAANVRLNKRTNQR